MKKPSQWAVYFFFAINFVLSLLDQGALLPYLIILQLPFLLVLFIKKEKLSLPLLKPIILVTIVFIINFFTSANKQFTFERILIWLTTFLVFWIFYNLNFQTKDKKLFINLLIYTSLLLIPFFLYYRITHTVIHTSALSMIQPMTGHVHISSLFLLSLTASFLTKRHLISLILLISLAATNSVSSFFALFLGSLLLITIPNKLVKPKIKIVTISIAIVIFTTLLALSSKTPKALDSIDPLWAKKTLGGARIHYWEQAFKGFIARPITGWGLDTSGIVSQKFMNDGYYSLYPHGFLFKILAETGLIGLMAFSYLVILLTKSVSLKSKENIIIASIIIISALESLTDFGWQFPSIMFILAGSLGIIVKKAEIAKTKTTTLLMISLLLAIISTGLVASTHFKRQGKYDLAQIFYPLDQEIYVENYEIINPKITHFFFGQDPNFWGKMAYKYQQNDELDKEINAREKELAKLKPSFSQRKKQELISLYLKNNQEKEATNTIFERIWAPIKTSEKTVTFTNQEKNIIDQLIKNNKGLIFSQINKISKQIDIQEKPQLFYTQLFYQLGLELYNENQPKSTEILWKKITKINPQWSHFHIELANLYWEKGEKKKAVNQLEEICSQYNSPRKHCLNYLKDYPYFQKPGSLENQIPIFTP